jgi:UDP-GlcNAc:undecaprenyl-phosphate GlcNAc-1-phosphate transferase
VSPASALTPLQSNYLNKRRVVEVLVDVTMIGASYYWATLAVFRDPEAYLRNADLFYESLPVIMATQLIAFFAMGLYRGLWRAFEFTDVVAVLKGIVIGTAIAQIFLFGYYGLFPIVPMVIAIQAGLLTAGVIATRLAGRMFPPN